LVALAAGCATNYRSQCEGLEKDGKWKEGVVSIEESVARRPGKAILSKAKGCIATICNELLPFARAAKVGRRQRS